MIRKIYYKDREIIPVFCFADVRAPDLVSQFFTHQIYLDTAGVHTASCHDDLVAEAFRGETIVADAGLGTGEFAVQTDRVGGRSHIADSGYAALYIGGDLIHTGNDDNMGRTLDQAGNAVTVAVDIDEFSACCDSVRAHKIVIGKNCSCVDLSGFLGRFCAAAVQKLIGTAVDRIQQAAFLQALAAAPADDGARGDFRQDRLSAGGGCVEVIAFHISLFQIFDDRICLSGQGSHFV